MKQNGELVLTVKVCVHDMQKGVTSDVLEDNVYSALSVFGEVDVYSCVVSPYDGKYENDAEVRLTLAVDSTIYDEDLCQKILSFDISSDDLEYQLNKCGLNSTVTLLDKEWEVA